MLTAIFGGTFNPFHMGHYEILKALEMDERVEKILLMPDKIPPHKSANSLIDDETRIKMCKLACEDFSKCELCLIEFEREGKSYTYDTVTELKKLYPETQFAFVCGGDMLVYFDKWWNYKKLLKMLPFIVFKRTVTKDEEFNNSVKRFSEEGMEIILKEEEIPTISSTELRENFNKYNYLLPEKIFKLLRESGVYGG